MSALSGAQMQALGMVEGAAEQAVQSNGVDLTAAAIERITGAGALYREGKTSASVEAVAPKYAPEHEEEVWVLRPGAYLVRFAETVRMPADVMGYLRPRSSLVRMGAAIHTGVFDAGYVGKPQCLLIVSNPKGVLLSVGARIGQLTAHRMEREAVQTYAGQYQGEGVPEVHVWEFGE